MSRISQRDWVNLYKKSTPIGEITEWMILVTPDEVWEQIDSEKEREALVLGARYWISQFSYNLFKDGANPLVLNYMAEGTYFNKLRDFYSLDKEERERYRDPQYALEHAKKVGQGPEKQ